MSKREWRFIDKSHWPEGPWQAEPDKVQWIDQATHLDCLAVRHTRSGHWCGYVGIAEGHPLFGRDFENCPDEIRVHGGLTFSNSCAEEDPEQGVCHVPEPGRPDRVWWLGFDCAHAGDVSPAHGLSIHQRDSYKPLEFIESQCAKLAAQLAALSASPSLPVSASSSQLGGDQP